MTKTINEYLYNGYHIFQMSDTGAYWYEVKLNKKRVSYFDSLEKAKEAIDEKSR